MISAELRRLSEQIRLTATQDSMDVELETDVQGTPGHEIADY